ncbi:MAG: hypothetical protein ACF8Q5_01260 [Phycisphaerales bacterium JB040]
MSPVRQQLDRLLRGPLSGVENAGEPCPCCGRPTGRFYRVRVAQDRAWRMACVLCTAQALEGSHETVIGGSATARDVAASTARKRRRRERREAGERGSLAA